MKNETRIISDKEIKSIHPRKDNKPVIRKLENENSDNASVVLSEQCCSNVSIYEISYDYIQRKWLVCNKCLELDFFKINIKEKVRIQS